MAGRRQKGKKSRSDSSGVSKELAQSLDATAAEEAVSGSAQEGSKATTKRSKGGKKNRKGSRSRAAPGKAEPSTCSVRTSCAEEEGLAAGEADDLTELELPATVGGNGYASEQDSVPGAEHAGFYQLLADAALDQSDIPDSSAKRAAESLPVPAAPADEPPSPPSAHMQPDPPVSKIPRRSVGQPTAASKAEKQAASKDPASKGTNSAGSDSVTQLDKRQPSKAAPTSGSGPATQGLGRHISSKEASTPTHTSVSVPKVGTAFCHALFG